MEDSLDVVTAKNENVSMLFMTALPDMQDAYARDQ
jgi:hypothetical protein